MYLSKIMSGIYVPHTSLVTAHALRRYAAFCARFALHDSAGTEALLPLVYNALLYCLQYPSISSCRVSL